MKIFNREIGEIKPGMLIQYDYKLLCIGRAYSHVVMISEIDEQNDEIKIIHAADPKDGVVEES
jgi:hypothetical protein